MNEYLASPVTPIVISVLAIAISISVIITVMSRRKKLRKEQERRRMELRVAQELEAERQAAERRRLRAAAEKGKPLRKVRLQDVVTRPWMDDEKDVPSRANTTGKPRVVPLPRSATTNRYKPAPQRSATSGESRRYDPNTDNVVNGALFGFLAADSIPDWSGKDDSGSRDSGSSHSNDSGSTGSTSHGDSSGGGSSGGDFSGGSSGSFSSDSGGGGDF
jgi:uncharacterized membrane protein YgcG